MNQEDMKNPNRRKMIRDSAIAATGAVLLPSFLSGCTKEMQDIIKDRFPKKGLGAPALTSTELQAAAENLNRMRDLLTDLYQTAFDYDEVVLLALGSTVTKQSSWTNFILNVIIDIAAAAAAATAVVAGVPLAVPAIACLSGFLHDWGIGKGTPPELGPLNGFFASYQAGHLAMKAAIDKHLGFLTELTDNYANLRAAWKDPIVFNGSTYTLSDLAKSFFPNKKDYDVEYLKIYEPMYLHHKKSVWNLAVMKCCTLYSVYYSHDSVTLPYDVSITSYVRESIYPKKKGVYARAHMVEDMPYVRQRAWTIIYWDLGIDGYELPEAASNILFMDDTPTHIINPTGLFNRSYVFQQFNTKKPDFGDTTELGYKANEDYGSEYWNFTGGLFPQLTTK